MRIQQVGLDRIANDTDFFCQKTKYQANAD